MLAVACAVLAKGPVGAALPALVILAFVCRESWRDGRSRPGDPLAVALAAIRRLWSWPLVALVVAADLGWYLLAFRQGGTEFLEVQLLHENVDRIVGRGVFGKHGGRSRFTMLIELATDLVPWNLVLVWAAYRVAARPRADDGERFLHAWWIVVVAVFTVAYGKRDVYLLPLYPAIALLAGRFSPTRSRVSRTRGCSAWCRSPTRPAAVPDTARAGDARARDHRVRRHARDRERAHAPRIASGASRC